jgi:hypothetical protein
MKENCFSTKFQAKRNGKRSVESEKFDNES